MRDQKAENFRDEKLCPPCKSRGGVGAKAADVIGLQAFAGHLESTKRMSVEFSNINELLQRMRLHRSNPK